MRKIWSLIKKGLVRLGDIMGTIMTAVILTVLFYVMVTPVGLFRRLTGKDPLKLRRSDRVSEFTENEILYTKQDLEKEY